ncbi:MAG: hypothetical protein IJR36_01460 [Lachnospiraceae bacterium]|nr:hypothetical protein [Lachnospiraceae bacterium]MBR0153770.1 hypothetical protein [Lachnospiraceae bacterium]
MSKVILCSGPLAAKPYLFGLTNRHLYSLEELCYSLYENVYVVSDQDFDESLCMWLDEQLDEKKLAKRLYSMIREEAPVEDKIALVLAASDYYTENEVKNTIYLMKQMGECSPVEKWKMKGDSYLEHGSYAQAAEEYEQLLRSEQPGTMRKSDYAKVMHNLAIAHLYVGSFEQAAEEFEKAAQADGNSASKIAAAEAGKLARGELPEYARAKAAGIREKDYDVLIEEWKEEIRKAFLRG